MTSSVGKSKKLAQLRVTRTQKLMETGGQLRDYRDRIDELIKKISSSEEFHSDLVNEIINIGTDIQGLARLVRPLSIEAKEKKLKRNMLRQWKVHCEEIRKKMSWKEYAEWMVIYSTRRAYDDRGSGPWMGPSEAFFEVYVKPSETIPEKP